MNGQRALQIWVVAVLSSLPGSAAGQLSEVRTFDGTGNNLAHPDWGSAGIPLLRKSPAAYPGDGSGQTIVEPPLRANPRDISNAVCAQGNQNLTNRLGLSDMAWQWGQFLDHDIDLTGSDAANGQAHIPVTDPTDVLFPGPIPFNRSDFDPATGTAGNPRQQLNAITAFIDGSVVYGSSKEMADSLRTFSGGMLNSSAEGRLLPTGDGGHFLSGDVRVNEQVALTVMHTLFMREHNRLAALISEKDPSLGDEEIYQTVRAIVGAEIQIITYQEFLPALLGWFAPSPWSGGRYDPELNPSIANEFSTASYRFGHSMLSPNLLLVDAESNTDHLRLRDAFFNPRFLKDDPTRVDQILRGLIRQPAQEVDIKVVDDVRSFLFGPPGAGGLDLASLNIQRGRDHGLPDYNTLREAYGLLRLRRFEQITPDLQVREALEQVYGSIEEIDPWVGGLAEDHHRHDVAVGPLVATVLRDQFIRLRDGDRFFWRRNANLKTPLVRDVVDLWSLRLSHVIRYNTGVDDVPLDVFHVPGKHRSGRRGTPGADQPAD